MCFVLILNGGGGITYTHSRRAPTHHFSRKTTLRSTTRSIIFLQIQKRILFYNLFPCWFGHLSLLPRSEGSRFSPRRASGGRCRPLGPATRRDLICGQGDFSTMRNLFKSVPSDIFELSQTAPLCVKQHFGLFQEWRLPRWAFQLWKPEHRLIHEHTHILFGMVFFGVRLETFFKALVYLVSIQSRSRRKKPANGQATYRRSEGGFMLVIICRNLRTT